MVKVLTALDCSVASEPHPSEGHFSSLSYKACRPHSTYPSGTLSSAGPELLKLDMPLGIL